MADESRSLLPRPQTADRYQKTTRTIARWEKDPDLGFPKATIINGRRYFRLDALEQWERSRAGRVPA